MEFCLALRPIQRHAGRYNMLEQPADATSLSLPKMIEMIEEATEGRVTGEVRMGLAPPPAQPLVVPGAAMADDPGTHCASAQASGLPTPGTEVVGQHQAPASPTHRVDIEPDAPSGTEMTDAKTGLTREVPALEQPDAKRR